MSGEIVTKSIDVLLFSVLKQRVSASSVSLKIREGMAAADLLDDLVEQYPVVAPFRTVMRLAVNQEYVGEEVRLFESEVHEVAVITPVSGG